MQRTGRLRLARAKHRGALTHLGPRVPRQSCEEAKRRANVSGCGGARVVGMNVAIAVAELVKWETARHSSPEPRPKGRNLRTLHRLVGRRDSAGLLDFRPRVPPLRPRFRPQPRYRLSEPGPPFKSWRRVIAGRCGCDRSAGARAYLGARPGGRRRDGRWVDPRGATPAARSLVDRRPWARVATAAGAGRKTGCHLRVVGLAERSVRGVR